MSDESKWDAAVSRLVRKTELGEVKWKAVPDAAGFCTASSDIVGVPYRAVVLDKTFFVYQYEYRYYHDVDEWSPAQNVAIELVNSRYDLEFRLPEVPSRWALLEAIREQASGASEFLDSFLSEDE